MDNKTKGYEIRNPLDLMMEERIEHFEYIKEEINYLQYTRDIISFMCKEKNDFEKNFNKFLKLIDSNKEVRILYSEISNNIYKIINDCDLENININLERIKDEIILNKFENYPEYKCIEKIIIKIYDHFNLAIYQLKKLNTDDENFKKRVGQVISPINNSNNKKIDKKLTQIDSAIKTEAGNLKNEFIGLIGMFTAMSFLVFGGLEFLGGIFSKIEDVPILKLIMIGSVWSLCISNLIYAFMFFIENIVIHRKVKNGQPKYLKRYPMIIISNYILVFIFLFSSWGYYCRKNKIDNIIFNLANNYSMIYFVMLIILLIASLIFIFKKLKTENKINQT
ncbi:hypothetical protein [Clostridium tertium]|uniref:hypothetical protein n=1 Tax=Clostridium tertium TaxID=1559 RepID=UPI001AE3E6EB|nr:hypothetical protein [Clostridium tertium]MBP1868764.1 DMSO/TMAO reductase YedYZ heme-binding membrane subunit [Clostridium tertium]